MIIENENYKIHYELADVANNRVAPIELLTGKYKGVIYQYGKSDVKKIDEEKGKLIFQYFIIDYAGHKEKVLDKSKDFVEYIGKILNEIMIAHYENDLTIEKVERPIKEEDDDDIE